MPDSTTAAKPAKPHKDFPLFAHATGRWAKKVKGRTVYFGSWSDPDSALKKWLDEKDDLLAGRTPRPKTDELTMRDLVNRYLTARKRRLQAGEIAPRTFDEAKAIALDLVAFMDAWRAVASLTPEDFGQYRAALAERYGPTRLTNTIKSTRGVFKWGFEAGLLESPMRFGEEFKPPSKRVRRKHRQKRGPRLFTAAEIRKLIAKCESPQLKAMILLAINGGMGNTDCAELPIDAIDWKRRLLDYPRPKTLIERRVPLWPETIEALKAAIDARPDPKDEANAGLVFITKYGGVWVKWREGGVIDSIAQEFGKLKTKAKIEKRGLGVYTLRHVFESIAGQTGDQAAVDRIMGHERDDMATIYREWARDKSEDARLRAVTNHVRAWLFPKNKKRARG